MTGESRQIAANDNAGGRGPLEAARAAAPSRDAYDRAGELVAQAHACTDPVEQARLFRLAAEILSRGCGDA